jgi:predicted phosphodiesterase
MRIGIFGDIHGNNYAFEKIWEGLESEGCDLYFFLGDVCGYYCYEDGIIDFLRTRNNIVSILGNHDDLFLRSLDDPSLEKEYMSKYGLANRYLKDQIRAENLEFLRSLPESYILDDYKCAFFHGSPQDPLNEYVYPDSDMGQFAGLPYRVVLLGHTHYSMDATAGDIRIINPGSAGQPRDGHYPSYAVLDCDSVSFRIKHISYNVGALISEISMRKDENPYLISVLERMKK